MAEEDQAKEAKHPLLKSWVMFEDLLWYMLNESQISEMGTCISSWELATVPRNVSLTFSVEEDKQKVAGGQKMKNFQEF